MHDILRKLRNEKNLTQQQVADYLQIGRTSYTHYESGRIRIDIPTMIKLAHFYNVSYAALIGSPEPAQEEEVKIPAIASERVTRYQIETNQQEEEQNGHQG